MDKLRTLRVEGGGKDIRNDCLFNEWVLVKLLRSNYFEDFLVRRFEIRVDSR